MPDHVRWLGVVVLAIWPWASLKAEPATDDSALEFFEKNVRPVLVQRCYECHSGSTEEPKGGLRVDSRAALLAGGDTGPAIDVAHPEKSLFLDAINYGDLYQMPPKSKMPVAEIAALTRWVEMGAPWPGEDAKAASHARQDFDQAARKQAHWAWRPVQNVEPPAVRDAEWPLQGLDAFILERLESEGITPAPPADRRTLLRRLYFDLVGLPPPPERVQAFVDDPNPNALDAVVDELLDSPHFGERWGRHWLDLVRYAESRGHEFDYDVPGAWHYRDYVIRALNADVPYDQFVREHLAGDLLPKPRLHPTEGFNESILGTGFWFLGEWVHSPVDIRQDETDRIDNMLDVASKTYLGLTLACARCHDHKFDAISQRDYYAMAGFLQSSAYRQVCFESQEHNARVAKEWQAVQEHWRSKLAAAVRDARQPTVDRLAEYLLASHEVLNGNGEPAPAVDEAAARHQVNTERLTSWVKHMREAKNNPRDPFHLWANIGGDASFPALRAKAIQDAESRRLAAGESLTNVHVIFDAGALAESEWMADGPTFGNGPVPAGMLVLGDRADAPILEVAEYAAVRRDPLWNGLHLAPGAAREPGRSGAWNRADRTFRTATFTIQAEYIYYLVRGSGHVYAVVDSHRVNNGPLHGSLIGGFQSVSQPQWIAQPLGRYQGHRAHLEFSARDDQPLEVLMVVQGGSAPGNPLDRPNELLVSMVSNSESLQDLASGYQALLQKAIKSLGKGEQLGTSTAGNEASLVNWMLEHPELTVEDPAHLARFKAVGEMYVAARRATAEKIQEESHTAPAMWDGSSVDEFLLIRGNPKAVGDPVPRRLLEALAGPEPIARVHGSGRLELAKQIASPENPLTARVMVNRAWHHLFGRGIVASVDNFGVLGEPPTHPELLDYLTQQFVNEGWSLKSLIRKIVLSRTYQMTSVANPKSIAADPANLLCHCQRVRRLEGEIIRDAVLAVSGRLDATLYGPSIPVHLTPFMQGRGRPSASGPLDGAGRRSIYGAVRRNFLSPMMLAFDTPAPFSTMGRRNVSNVPAQALILMNDPFVVEQARLWAERELSNSHLSTEEHLTRLYMAAFARRPATDEVTAAQMFLDQQAKEMGIPAPEAPTNPRVWGELCHALFNIKEFIFIH